MVKPQEYRPYLLFSRPEMERAWRGRAGVPPDTDNRGEMVVSTPPRLCGNGVSTRIMDRSLTAARGPAAAESTVETPFPQSLVTCAQRSR